jgi:ferric-dicitrate binding protein FerR (iron transport regulator)/TolA-binding protein
MTKQDIAKEMTMNRPSRTPREVRFDKLARMVRYWSEHPQAEVPTPAWLAHIRNVRSTARSSTPSSRQAWTRSASRSADDQGGWSRRRLILNLTAAAAAAVIAVMVVRGFGRPDRTITFLVSNGTTEQGVSATAGRVTSTEQPARLSFSDGSDVRLQPRTRGTVVGTTARGARVRLEEGGARFAVVHRPGTNWTVEAGPFVVIVHGTVFDLSWSTESGALAVNLIAGAITVEGPLSNVQGASATTPTMSIGSVALKAGQRLTARASTGTGRIDPIASASNAGGVRGGEVASSEIAVAPPVAPPATAPKADSEPLQQPIVAATSRFKSDGHPSARSATEVAEVTATWPARVGSGAFESVVTEADAIGIGRCLSKLPAQSLNALADAARYARRTDLARRVLLAERRRFSGSTDAHDAAFLLGRLVDDATGDTRDALFWYGRYLEESEHGTYAPEALGRKMAAHERLGEAVNARRTAEAYLETYSRGAFANRARKILGSHSGSPSGSR